MPLFVSIMRFKPPAIGWPALLLFCGLMQIGAQTPPATGGEPRNSGFSKGAFKVGGGVSGPKAIWAPDPEYPEEGRKSGNRGTCVLWLVVGPDGRPRDIKVLQILGTGLDEKAVEAVQRWRLEPGMKDGVPVAVQINVKVSFELFDALDNTFQKAESGDASAQFEISQVLFSGNGMPQNESRGFAYLEKAAKQGLPKAQFGMGEYFLSHGNDLIDAYVWYARAQQNRYKHSKKRLKELVEKMTPEQLTEARGRAEGK